MKQIIKNTLIFLYRFLFYKDHPKIYLYERHIKNAKLLTNRVELLRQLPKGGLVAEIGVDEGVFSGHIYRICKPEKLYLIDSWNSKRYGLDKMNHVFHLFDVINVDVLKADSVQSATMFKDYLFDFIYLDTDHSYELTKKELEVWRLKIKQSGIIAGHDYTKGNFKGLVQYGVIEAVNEFCLKHNWELIYLTLGEFPSFAIRRI